MEILQNSSYLKIENLRLTAMVLKVEKELGNLKQKKFMFFFQKLLLFQMLHLFTKLNQMVI